MNWWKRFKKWQDGECRIMHCECGEDYAMWDTLPGMVSISMIERETFNLLRHLTHRKQTLTPL